MVAIAFDRLEEHNRRRASLAFKKSPAGERSVMPTRARERSLVPHESSVPFLIEEVVRFNELAFLFVRALEPDRTWSLSEHSTIGGFPLHVRTPTPTPHDLRGTNRTDVFLLQLRRAEDRQWFQAGDRVLLES
jgi:hypothetical protein